MFDDENLADDGVNVLIDFSTKVNLVRVVGNSITPARLSIKAEVLPSPDAQDIDFDITFAKIRFWIENIVSRTVVFSRNNTTALRMLTDTDGQSLLVNHLMITPHDPTDEHLGALFQAKMTALSSGTMQFGAVRVNSESPTGLVWSYIGDWRDDLPTMEAWFPKKPYYFDRPWWARNDISTIDMIGKNTTDFSEIPAWAYTLDFLENAIRPHAATKEGGEDEPKSPETVESVVIRGAFRPKVIDTSITEE